MNRSSSLAVVVAGLAALLSSPTAGAAEPMKLSDAGAVFNQWIAAYAARDTEKLMAVYDKTLVSSAQSEADQTYAELKAGYLSFFATKSPPTRWKAIPKEIHAQGSLAVVVSIWEQRAKDSSGAEELVARVRSIDVFRNTKAGWKIVRTMNYPEAD